MKTPLFIAIKDKKVVPQKFKDAEVQLYKNSRAHSLETVVYSFTCCRKKKLLSLLE